MRERRQGARSASEGTHVFCGKGEVLCAARVELDGRELGTRQAVERSLALAQVKVERDQLELGKLFLLPVVVRGKHAARGLLGDLGASPFSLASPGAFQGRFEVWRPRCGPRRERELERRQARDQLGRDGKVEVAQVEQRERIAVARHGVCLYPESRMQGR